MPDNKDTYTARLEMLGLSSDEATIYLELLKGMTTHLRLSRDTGITRSKVYRLVDLLEKRGLVAKYVDDRGKFIEATSPTNLGIELSAKEEQLKEQRSTLNQLVNSLTILQQAEGRDFLMRTYEGEDGFRQMLWHELKTKGELLALSHGAVENLVSSHNWAEKHRTLTAEAGYHIRELVNTETEIPINFTRHKEYMELYSRRSIRHSILPLDNQIVIYNDTVAMYHWKKDQRIGLEIVNQPYAETMRRIFNDYWNIADDQPKDVPFFKDLASLR